jgi:hypothetical protein
MFGLNGVVMQKNVINQMKIRLAFRILLKRLFHVGDGISLERGLSLAQFLFLMTKFVSDLHAAGHGVPSEAPQVILWIMALTDYAASYDEYEQSLDFAKRVAAYNRKPANKRAIEQTARNRKKGAPKARPDRGVTDVDKNAEVVVPEAPPVLPVTVIMSPLAPVAVPADVDMTPVIIARQLHEQMKSSRRAQQQSGRLRIREN